jgi:hypothetical protein
MRKFIATICTVTLLFASASLAVAQDAATIRGIFASAPKEATTVGAVTIFSGPPKGFNPLTASGEELARYGLPQRPDQTADPAHYTRWAKAMAALQTRATGLTEMPYHHSPMKQIATRSSAQAIANVPSTTGSYNWSGVANLNKLTKWNVNTSFTEVESFWPVPVAQPPLSACANGITGPFLESTWNGIDGFNSGDVIQGGSSIYSACTGKPVYNGWVEWYPSYAELQIDCGSKACLVSPGDVFYVVTYATSGTATQTVFEEDTTQGWYITASLPWVSGPGLIGNSEEQVVERPCCTTAGDTEVDYALNHYNYEWFSDANGTDGKGTAFYAGEQTTLTYIITMYDDSGTIPISYVDEQGTAGNAGKYSLFFSDENCAYSGGCTP